MEEKSKKKPKRKNYHTKLTKETIDKLYQELSRGVPIRHACTLAGISKETYYRWKKLAEEEPDDSDSLLAYFKRMNKEGIAMAVATRVEHIRTDESWQSSAWWLERMAYEDFGKKQTIDANVDAKVKSEDISKLFDNAKVSKILDEEKNTD
jgi:hypothetical protein